MKKQTLGFWTLSALVIGNMIGSGVFLLPSSLAKLGTISILSWIFTGCGAILLALVFAKLSTIFPKTGGPYVYCREGFGDFIGFQVAYNYWIYMWVGNAAIAIALTGYLTPFFPFIADNNLVAFLITASIIWLITLINMLGIQLAGRVQLIFTIVKFVPLILLGLIGIFFVKSENLSLFNITSDSNLTALSSGAILTLWAFLGLESASIPADNVKDPKKNIPRATIFGTVVTALLYIVTTVAIMGVIPATELKESSAPFADFASILFGQPGKIFIGIIAIISCFSALNGWILLQAQIPLAAAKDHLFPKKFGHVTSKGAPIFGLFASSCLVTVLLVLNYNKNLVDKFTFIISLATLAALITYLYSTIAEFVIYLNHPDKINKKSVKKSLTIAFLAFIYVFWAIMSAGEDIIYYGALLMFSSVPLYGWMQWQKYLTTVKQE